MTARKAADSFDAFWAEQAKGGRTTIIRNVTVPVPTDIPIAMELRAQELQESSAEADIRELLAMLFGADVLDQWSEEGMGLRELQTVLAWGMGQGAGNDTTFEEAYASVLDAAREGKAPSGQNRATRRAGQKPQSARTGGPSKRTSAASTASKRVPSRA